MANVVIRKLYNNIVYTIIPPFPAFTRCIKYNMNKEMIPYSYIRPILGQEIATQIDIYIESELKK